ncbi:hypothetical protein [Parapedobacter indicus]|uniref:HEPN domain-containing protein n=1 Tax=Parapedobacter indicus TaxID=1477437 RepID=A0A1I3N7J8_9SPHI|nr:hypothetical protein [Parapedobacter indicus]PPL00903.1 hypothetical protein CLV26_107123 [Parapedobacter indicus]SFJ05234.1 hypothetical protein SAMN05444682_107123 [Parapedobacter indicus]
MNPTFRSDPVLRLIVQRITVNLLIDQIYLHPYTIQGRRVNQLYILLRNSVGQGIVSARALCNLAVSEKPAYRCHVAFPDEVNRKIKQGNMRATLICQPDKLIFEHPEVHTRIQLPEVDYGAWCRQAKAHFAKEVSKIDAFAEGYSFYVNKENYGQAAFMLHQVIEQGYRAAENLVMGKEKISHSLRNHQEYIAPFCPELGVLFEKQHELSIMGKLDESYSSARYDHDFSMSKEDLTIAANKGKELLAYLTAFNRDLLDEIQRRQVEEEALATKDADNRQAVDSESTESKIPNSDDHRERILSAIRQYFLPTHVFCFACQSREERSVNLVIRGNREIAYHRYYLAILTKEQPDQALHKQHQINEVLGEELEIVALYFRLETFNRKLKEREVFFHFLANTAERWVEEDEVLVRELVSVPIEVKHRRFIWGDHLRNANGLMSMAIDHLGDRYSECTAVVIAQAIEQLCLGWLYAFWSYCPENSLNLMYLIRLTESISPLVRTCFCLDVSEERELVVQLSEALNEFRYSSRYYSDQYALNVMYDRLAQFERSLSRLVNLHFETLEVVD